jgi:hypothetical protein
MHLSDFSTSRDEVRVYCGRCWRVESKQVTHPWATWRAADSDYRGLVTVVALTPNAEANMDGNHPNVCNLTFVESKPEQAQDGEKRKSPQSARRGRQALSW